MNRETLLTKNKKKSFRGDIAFITSFHRQYRDVEKIFKKHWAILMKDRDLRKVVPIRPQFIYKRSPGLRNKIEPNIPDPLKRVTNFLDWEGFHCWTRCKACETSKSNKRKI